MLNVLSAPSVSGTGEEGAKRVIGSEKSSVSPLVAVLALLNIGIDG